MSLFSTMRTGASGLGVAGMDLSVIGDNIANIGTIGYKQSRASFADFLPQDVFGLAGSSQLGSGSVTNKVSTLFGQGTIQSSTNSLDMAISGGGFFVVGDEKSRYYTRAGEFTTDTEGYITTLGGLHLQGYTAEDDVLTGTIGDLRVDTTTLPGTATSTIVLDMMLSSDTEAGTDLAALTFHGTGTGTATLADAAAAADFTTSVTFYDSLGNSHEATVCFERSSEADWTYRVLTDGSEVYDSTGAVVTSTAGEAFEIATGTLTFDTDGKLTTVTTGTGASGWSFYGSAEPALTFDFGLDATGTATDGAVAMQGETNSVSALSQDGNGTGELAGVSVDETGTIVAAYSNGEERILGQVLLATFPADAGLERVGGSLFQAGVDAGQPALGVAGTGGRGAIAGYALEKSNVELEDQFVAMISAQRSYQANSKVISTASDTLSSLLQIV